MNWSNQFAAPGSGPVGYCWLAQTFDPDGPGPAHAELYFAGSLQSSGGITTKGIARWDGHQFFDVGGGLYRVTSPNTSRVLGLGLHDPDGPGPLAARLIAAGNITMAGTVPVNYIAAWDGSTWSALGAGLPLTFAPLGSDEIAMCDWDPDGPGPQLPILVVALGGLVYTWDGQQWGELPLPPGGVLCAGTFDEDGPGPQNESLFLGLKHSPGLVRWNGTEWEIVGGGLRSAQHLCTKLRVIDIDGPGPLPSALFVSGGFHEGGTTAVNGVATWDGQNWSPVGEGITDQIADVVAVDYTQGAGAPTLFAVGDILGQIFRLSPGATTWELIGTHNLTFSSSLPHLAVFDEDAPGDPSVYLAGPTTLNNRPTGGLSRYGCICYPNCDGSLGTPTLTSNDFVCFINNFAFGDSFANCDGSTGTPALTGNDFTCFLNSYAAGCF